MNYKILRVARLITEQHARSRRLAANPLRVPELENTLDYANSLGIEAGLAMAMAVLCGGISAADFDPKDHAVRLEKRLQRDGKGN